MCLLHDFGILRSLAIPSDCLSKAELTKSLFSESTSTFRQYNVTTTDCLWRKNLSKSLCGIQFEAVIVFDKKIFLELSTCISIYRLSMTIRMSSIRFHYYYHYKNKRGISSIDNDRLLIHKSHQIHSNSFLRLFLSDLIHKVTWYNFEVSDWCGRYSVMFNWIILDVKKFYFKVNKKVFQVNETDASRNAK